MKIKSRLCTMLVPTLLVTGCAGYDRALLITKTNIGIDIDSTPPTAEVTIARREIAIQPTYPFSVGEKALPLLASFGLQGGFFNPQITSYFAGGMAANHIIRDDDTPLKPLTLTPTPSPSPLPKDTKDNSENQKKPENATLCVEKNPEDTRSWIVYLYHKFIGKTLEEYRNETKPFYFATDTSYGLKVAWSGTTGPYPDTLKLGYNRKEFAAPPVFVEQGCKNKKEHWEVKMPSFLASTDNASNLDSVNTGGVKHIQFFATGTVANTFAQRPSVRRIAFAHMAPKAEKLETEFLNKSLVEEIKTSYESGDDNKKDKIIVKAKSLKIVSLSVPKTQFLTELQKSATIYSSASISNDLNILRVYSAM